MSGVPQVLTVDEFAKNMKISKSYAYRVVRGMPDHMKTTACGSVRILVDGLTEWLKSGGNRAQECAE
jgi:predicted transcriptional regulator